jgi:hypothetical protein
MFCFFSATAQRVVTVSGEYRYVVPGDVPLNRAKQIAIDKARNAAIANEFGQVVSQSTSTTIHTTEAKSSVQSNSYASTESRAIWLSDTAEPKVDISYENDVMVIIASVCGKVRELKTAEVELKMQILNNGIEADRFKSNDRVTVKLKSPVSGYVAIFFRDDNAGVISCMMPYENENGTAREVKSNKEYIYLSTEDPIYPYKEQTILVTDKTVEFDTFILVFSKKPFSMPASESGVFVPELSVENFQKWLRRNRINDETMQTIEKTVQIHK